MRTRSREKNREPSHGLGKSTRSRPDLGTQPPACPPEYSMPYQNLPTAESENSVNRVNRRQPRALGPVVVADDPAPMHDGNVLETTLGYSPLLALGIDHEPPQLPP